jgi:hypothetical protein
MVHDRRKTCLEIDFTTQKRIMIVPVIITLATTAVIVIATARAAAASAVRSAALGQDSVRAVQGVAVARRAAATSARLRYCC